MSWMHPSSVTCHHSRACYQERWHTRKGEIARCPFIHSLPAASPAFHPSRPVESDSRRLWIGLVVSAVGTWMQIVALSLLVLDPTQGSAVALGTVSLAPALYFLLFATESQEPSAALQIFKAAPAGLAACGVGHLAVRP